MTFSLPLLHRGMNHGVAVRLDLRLGLDLWFVVRNQGDAGCSAPDRLRRQIVSHGPQITLLHQTRQTHAFMDRAPGPVVQNQRGVELHGLSEVAQGAIEIAVLVACRFGRALRHSYHVCRNRARWPFRDLSRCGVGLQCNSGNACGSSKIGAPAHFHKHCAKIRQPRRAHGHFARHPRWITVARNSNSDKNQYDMPGNTVPVSRHMETPSMRVLRLALCPVPMVSNRTCRRPATGETPSISEQ